MIASVLLGLLAAMCAPWINRLSGRWAGHVLAIAPLGMAIYFATRIPAIAAGESIRASVPWAPGLDVQFSFFLDGLSLLFALLITGIGTLIVLYAGPYLEGHRDRGRFFAWLLLFMASMLGLVIADNIVTLFIFWELTSISSYFLIGFDHHREIARKSALQALLITGGGGLALLAGLVMMALIGDSWELSDLLADGEVFREHALYAPILLLILLGCFTKSAQFPFHFWLPNAMEAPTPVSAYLHSSTMVKAGIYLMARLSPALGGTEMWLILLTAFGGATMLIGAFIAIQQTYLKRILAYSTVSALGVLTFLLGLGAAGAIMPEVEADLALYAAQAFAVFLLAHALYKATLFLVAGSVTHETGVADVRKLGGLRRAMPITCAAAVLAALSMAGFPPFFGFISKELLLEATLAQPELVGALTAVAVITGVLFVVVSMLVVVRPFFGRSMSGPHESPPDSPAGGTPALPVHEAPRAMWIGPALLGLFGLALGLLPGFLGEPLIAPTVASVLGAREPVEVQLVLWHGFNIALALGAGAIALGVILYAVHGAIMRVLRPVQPVMEYGPERWYDWGLAGTMRTAEWQTRQVQSGYLRRYLLITIATAVALIGYAILQIEGLSLVPALPEVQLHVWVYQNLYRLLTAALILVGTYGAVHSRSRLGAIASLGVVGYGVALIYILYGAPDLAITQFLIETLTVILFVLVFYHLPEFPKISTLPERTRDLVVAVTAGVMMGVLVLIATAIQIQPKISDLHAEGSVPLGHGRNIVNVILVDFRALDTLGEITVLGMAAIGVLALLKLRPSRPPTREGPQAGDRLKPKAASAMNSIILRAATRYLAPIVMLFSLFMLLRGHDEPGGGFIAGLLAAVAFALYALAHSVPAARRVLRVDEHVLIGAGLLLAASAGLFGLFDGEAYFRSAWVAFDAPGLGEIKLGTPLLFDVGVYLVVTGVTLMIVFSLAEE